MAKVTIAGGLHTRPINHLAELEDNLEKQATEEYYAAKGSFDMGRSRFANVFDIVGRKWLRANPERNQ